MTVKKSAVSKSTRPKDVLTVMKDQHTLLRESMKVLNDEETGESQKRSALQKFIDLLKMHADAEENTIYEVMHDVKFEEMLTLESIEEHKIAKDLIFELESLNYKEQWSPEIEAKARVLTEIVDQHALKEESEFFKEARRTFTNLELEALGEEFLDRCQRFQEEREVAATKAAPPVETVTAF